MTRSWLSADAELVHRALLSSGPVRPGTIAGDLGLSLERTKIAFSALRAAGLAHAAGVGARQRWTAVAGSHATASRQRHIPTHRVLAMPEQLRQLASRAEFGEGLRFLPSPAANTRRQNELYGRQPRESWGISPELGWDEDAFRRAASGSHWVRKIGMATRELGVLPPNPQVLVPYGGLAMLPDTYRQAPEVPMKLIIIDRQFAFFPVDPSNYKRGFLEVSQKPIVESLVALFEREWDRAGPQPQEPHMSKFHLTAREQAVIAQLVQGQTDAGTARALHLSERTVSSIVRTMMERLEVRNRFQLGVALGRLDAAPMPTPRQRSSAGT